MTKEEFISKAQKSHGNVYDYSKVIINKTADLVTIVCKEHGEFSQEANCHINKNYGCPSCGKLKAKATKKDKYNTEYFVNKAVEVHGTTYDYSRVVYTKTNSKVTIICPIHKEFEQRAQSHLQGSGCHKCALANNNYWSYTGWEVAGDNSKYFDGYKVYVLKLFNEGETFYKIGKTYNPVWLRFSRGQIPYEYSVVKIFEGSARYICELEQKLLNLNTEYRYSPKLHFAGNQECFVSLEGIKDYNGY